VHVKADIAQTPTFARFEFSKDRLILRTDPQTPETAFFVTAGDNAPGSNAENSSGPLCKGCAKNPDFNSRN